MCSEPITRAPASGFFAPCCARSAISPGISCSASRISFRPKSASERTLTLYGSRPAACAASNACIFSVTVAIRFSWLQLLFRRRHEEPGTLDPRVGRHRDDARVREAAVLEQARDLRLAESEPHVTHLLPI